jgi:uncharacterized protein (DUF433 family)
MTIKHKAQLDEIVWINPERLRGEPCFRGTHIPVQVLIAHIKEIRD